MKQYLERITTSKVFLGVIAGLLLYALAGFWLTPYLLERYVPRYAQEQLGSRATIADVRLASCYAAVSSGERPPRRWLLQHAQLRGGTLTFSDLSGRTPLRTTFEPINLEVLSLATLPDRHGRYALTAAVPDGGTITWHGDVSLLPWRHPRGRGSAGQHAAGARCREDVS